MGSRSYDEKLSGINSDQILDIALIEAKEICDEDEKFCENIGIYGLEIIEEVYNKKKDTVNILTHCNAGWLATINWGTATSPIYHAHKKVFQYMFGLMKQDQEIKEQILLLMN